MTIRLLIKTYGTRQADHLKENVDVALTADLTVKQCDNGRQTFKTTKITTEFNSPCERWESGRTNVGHGKQFVHIIYNLSCIHINSFISISEFPLVIQYWKYSIGSDTKLFLKDIQTQNILFNNIDHYNRLVWSSLCVGFSGHRSVQDYSCL